MGKSTCSWGYRWGYSENEDGKINIERTLFTSIKWAISTWDIR